MSMHVGGTLSARRCFWTIAVAASSLAEVAACTALSRACSSACCSLNARCSMGASFAIASILKSSFTSWRQIAEGEANKTRLFCCTIY